MPRMPEGEGGEARGRLSCSRVIARRVCRAARRSDWTPTANNKHKHQLSPKSLSLSQRTATTRWVDASLLPSCLWLCAHLSHSLRTARAPFCRATMVRRQSRSAVRERQPPSTVLHECLPRCEQHLVTTAPQAPVDGSR